MSVLSPPAARTPPRPPCPAARRGSPSPRKARPGPAEPLPEGEELRDRGAGRWRLRRLLEQGGCGLLYEGAGPGGSPSRGEGGETGPRDLRTADAGTERFTLLCVSEESGLAALLLPCGSHFSVLRVSLGQAGTQLGAGLLPECTPDQL